MKHSIVLTEQTNIPLVGLGTYLIPEQEVSSVVQESFRLGYRHVDTAEGYRNETGVGLGLQSVMKNQGLRREDIFVTTKLWPGNPAWGQTPKNTETTIESLHTSLKRLQLDYVDLYLIHAPYDPEQRLQQWHGLVELQRQGKVLSIGVSNFSEKHIEEIRAAGLPLPDANQIELHPWSQKVELVSYLKKNEITPIAYSSLIPLSTWRAVGGQDSAKTEDMKAEGEKPDFPFKKMAKKYDVSEAQVLLRWAIQKGYPVLPKTANPTRLRQNIDLFSFSIDEDDMVWIETMDRGDGIAWAIGDPIKAS